LWLFGYGSLYLQGRLSLLEQRPAAIEGWGSPVWQGSMNNRGTPMRLGRVLTLIEAPNVAAKGMA